MYQARLVVALLSFMSSTIFPGPAAFVDPQNSVVLRAVVLLRVRR